MLKANLCYIVEKVYYKNEPTGRTRLLRSVFVNMIFNIILIMNEKHIYKNVVNKDVLVQNDVEKTLSTNSDVENNTST